MNRLGEACSVLYSNQGEACSALEWAVGLIEEWPVRHISPRETCTGVTYLSEDGRELFVSLYRTDSGKYEMTAYFTGNKK